MKRQNRNLRATKFTKILEQKMELVLQYVWAPVAGWLIGLSKIIHSHGKDIASIETSQGSLTTAVEDAKTSRKEIYDKVESVRAELTSQHDTLRKEQRQDFQEIRTAISNIGK